MRLPQRIAWLFACAEMLLLLAACAPSRPIQAQTLPTPILDTTTTPTILPTVVPHTLTPTSSATPTITTTPTITPTPTCTEAGEAVSHQFDSSVLNYPLQMQVYLPPCYDWYPDRRYPVLYLLHGLGHTPDIWSELGTIELANQLIANGETVPFIIVMPWEQRDDRFDRAFVEELLPWIEASFRTIPNRRYRALGGISRGGAWTARIGFQHPELFGALGFHSMSIFNADEDQMSHWLNAISNDLWPRIYIDIGERDGLIVSAGWLDRALTRREVPHLYLVDHDGTHTKEYWAANMQNYLRFYTAGWQETNAEEINTPDR